MTVTSIRLFVPGPLEAGAECALGVAPAHYLTHVMRLAVGDSLLVFDGQNGEWRATVAKISRQSVVLRVEHQTRAPEHEPDCWLCFALLKRQKTDLVVEKATELGVRVIQPLLTQRTQGDHVNMSRLQNIAIEAAEQCERFTVPEIRPPVALSALLAGWPERRLYVADERREGPVLGPKPPGQPCALMVGPEGGFTAAEVEAIASQPLVTRVSLGRRILRAETAAIAGLALLLAAETG